MDSLFTLNSRKKFKDNAPPLSIGSLGQSTFKRQLESDDEGAFMGPTYIGNGAGVEIQSPDKLPGKREALETSPARKLGRRQQSQFAPQTTMKHGTPVFAHQRVSGFLQPVRTGHQSTVELSERGSPRKKTVLRRGSTWRQSVQESAHARSSVVSSRPIIFDEKEMGNNESSSSRAGSSENDDLSQSLSSEADRKTGQVNLRISKIIKEDQQETEILDRVRKALTIPPSSPIYQAWKVLLIVLCFVSSFQYAYFATFMRKISAKEKLAFNDMDIKYTVIFSVDILVGIMLNEHHESEGKWTLKKSCLKQVKGSLGFDLIALIPFTRLFSEVIPEDLVDLLFFLKVVRLYRGFKLLDYKKYKKQLKEAQQQTIERLIRRGRGQQAQRNTSNMTSIVFFTHLVKTGRLIINLLCLSYFTGLVWMIISRLIYENSTSVDPTFYEAYNLLELPNFDVIMSLTYFAFTTLSTVGLGDFHPKTSVERIICSFIMLFGVMTTSILMEQLGEMIKELRNFNKSYEEEDNLNLFMRTLEKFNGGQPISEDMSVRLEEFFRYRWKMDKNLALNEDSSLMAELPLRVRTQIYVDFLFRGFVDTYKHFLDIISNQHFFERKKLLRNPTFTKVRGITDKMDSSKFFNSETYEILVIKLLTFLEPIQLQPGQIIFKQSQREISEAYFMMTGEVEVGFSQKHHFREQQLQFMEQKQLTNHYNRFEVQMTSRFMKQLESKMGAPSSKGTFPLSFKPGQVVGLFEMIFDVKCQFTYRAKLASAQDHDWKQLNDRRFDCLFIRRENFNRIQSYIEQNAPHPEKAKQVLNELKSNVIQNYVEKIYLPMKEQQEKQAAEGAGKEKMKKNLLLLMMGKEAVGRQARALSEDSSERFEAETFEDLVDRLDLLKKHNNIRHLLNLILIRQYRKDKSDSLCSLELNSLDKLNLKFDLANELVSSQVTSAQELYEEKLLMSEENERLKTQQEQINKNNKFYASESFTFVERERDLLKKELDLEKEKTKQIKERARRYIFKEKKKQLSELAKRDKQIADLKAQLSDLKAEARRNRRASQVSDQIQDIVSQVETRVMNKIGPLRQSETLMRIISNDQGNEKGSPYFKMPLREDFATGVPPGDEDPSSQSSGPPDQLSQLSQILRKQLAPKTGQLSSQGSEFQDNDDFDMESQFADNKTYGSRRPRQQSDSHPYKSKYSSSNMSEHDVPSDKFTHVSKHRDLTPQVNNHKKHNVFQDEYIDQDIQLRMSDAEGSSCVSGAQLRIKKSPAKTPIEKVMKPRGQRTSTVELQAIEVPPKDPPREKVRNQYKPRITQHHSQKSIRALPTSPEESANSPYPDSQNQKIATPTLELIMPPESNEQLTFEGDINRTLSSPVKIKKPKLSHAGSSSSISKPQAAPRPKGESHKKSVRVKQISHFGRKANGPTSKKFSGRRLAQKTRDHLTGTIEEQNDSMESSDSELKKQKSQQSKSSSSGIPVQEQSAKAIVFEESKSALDPRQHMTQNQDRDKLSIRTSDLKLQSPPVIPLTAQPRLKKKRDERIKKLSHSSVPEMVDDETIREDLSRFDQSDEQPVSRSVFSIVEDVQSIIEDIFEGTPHRDISDDSIEEDIDVKSSQLQITGHLTTHIDPQSPSPQKQPRGLGSYIEEGGQSSSSDTRSPDPEDKSESADIARSSAARSSEVQKQ